MEKKTIRTEESTTENTGAGEEIVRTERTTEERTSVEKPKKTKTIIEERTDEYFSTEDDLI